MHTSVIISTYNQPDWLDKAVAGWACQTAHEFELIIADDGSGPETAARIEALRERTGLAIRHVWQPDKGFRKTKILNQAIRESDGDYIVVSDGDCIPRRDFLAVHTTQAEPGAYLSGGYFKLPMAVSRAITEDDIRSGRAFDLHWLKSHGEPLPGLHSRLRMTARGHLARMLNHLTPTNPTWNGHNASGWKADILAVNGFDERMRYGGEDREMGMRLVNHGIRPKQIRYSTVCVHLDHARGYVTATARRRNAAVMRNTARKRRDRTPYGIARSV